MRIYPNFGKLILTILMLFQLGRISGQYVNKHDLFIPFDSVLTYLEQKRSVNLYFKPEWFAKKQFHSSIIQLSTNEILNLIKNASNCSFMAIDSLSFVLVPNDQSNISVPVAGSVSYTTIGNPAEYGKYSKAILSGKIVDGKTGKPLAGARIYVVKSKIWAVTDKNGDFTINLPIGYYDIKLSYIGYENNISKIKLIGNGSSNFEILEKSVKLNEVVITAERLDHNLTNTQMSFVQFNTKDIKELPVSLGETDIIKSVTLLPGIQTIGEFGTGFNVRGSSADENLILIEDVPIFNSSHLFGLTSILNPDGVSDVTLLKAGIPAKYGERASSLVDIRMDNSNFDKIKAKGGIGLINSRLTIEAPIVKNKVNLLIGGRTTYSDWLLHSIPDIDLMNSSAKFYDLNTFLTIAPDNKNKINVFGYYSNDDFELGQNIHYKYGNSLASLNWNHVINKKLSLSLSTGFSRYNYEVSEVDTFRITESYRITSKVLYSNAKWNLSWHPNNNHSFDFGINAVFYSVSPGDLQPYTQKSLVLPIQVHKENAGEYAIYVSDNFNILPELSTEIGTRYTYYMLKGPGKQYNYTSGGTKSAENISDTVNYKSNKVIKSYSGIEPRISLRYRINELSSIKLSYNRIKQYINLVSNTSVMTPSDVWKLSDSYIQPLKCDQYAIGYFRNFSQNMIEASAELYYKSLQNIIDYKNGAQILLNDHIETDVVNAKGYNYGAELYIKKNFGRLTGWVSYTYSKSMRKTTSSFLPEKIDNNNYFPSNYDRPHNLVINANYHISKRWRFSGSFSYNTGRPVTLPELKYDYNGYDLIYYSDRNKYRLPDYHRLDVAITLDESLRIRKKWKGSWTLSIINLYGRKNAYSAFYQQETRSASNNFNRFNLYQLYIIGRPLPTLTYNFSF